MRAGCTHEHLNRFVTMLKLDRDRVAFHLFWVSAALLGLGYGVLAGMFQWFPQGWFAGAVQGLQQIQGGRDDAWYFKTVKSPGPPAIANSGHAQPGVNLVTEILADELSIKVMDLEGKVLHRWPIDWFKIWPEANHIPERLRPRERPGTHVDGAALLPDGGVVFHFEHLGLVRLAPDGAIVWKLPYQTHHSVVLGGDGNLWVCGQKEHTSPMPGFPSLMPPFVEDMVLVVTPDGKVVKEWSVPELLRANGRIGLLCLANPDNFSTAVSGDVTHLNHVEPFPEHMIPGAFGPGDVLVSLRNVNTVFVFSSRTQEIRFLSTGQFVRQHDPHFVDGDTLSVFDNNTGAPGLEQPQSRIVLVHAPDQALKVCFAGTRENPFYSPILGRHQWLANGNLLITDSCAGRAFEVDRNHQVVWWYINYVREGVVGAVEQVQRLPAEVAARYH